MAENEQYQRVQPPSAGGVRDEVHHQHFYSPTLTPTNFKKIKKSPAKTLTTSTTKPHKRVYGAVRMDNKSRVVGDGADTRRFRGILATGNTNKPDISNSYIQIYLFMIKTC